MKNIDYKAISHWFATGFFENNKKSFLKNEIYHNQFGPNFEWFYEPRNISFKSALYEFGDLFESILDEKIKNKKVVLPLSGGLDSRTIAAALRKNKNIVTYSYEFDRGNSETKYAEKIAKLYDWEFHKFIIKEGYLWRKIEDLAHINKCRAEFTHPRQMAIIEKVSKMGEILLSGSNGDVLFDSFSINKFSGNNSQRDLIKKIIIKKSGFEFAQDFWQFWSIEGDFNNYINQIIDHNIKKINIEDSSSKIKAIKIESYSKNWTSTNLQVFNHFIPTFAPYHDERICSFICSIPEDYLKNRKMQIAYIKQKSPSLAKIPWQAYDLNLYQYKLFKTFYFPRRVFRLLKRNINHKIFKKPKPIIRNWELQFLNGKNKKHLEKWLFNNSSFNDLVPNDLVLKYYKKFSDGDKVNYSHIISMLLTLSVWSAQKHK